MSGGDCTTLAPRCWPIHKRLGQAHAHVGQRIGASPTIPSRHLNSVALALCCVVCTPLTSTHAWHSPRTGGGCIWHPAIWDQAMASAQGTPTPRNALFSCQWDNCSGCVATPTSEISALTDYDACNARQPFKQDHALTEALLRMLINRDHSAVDRTKPGGAHSTHIPHDLKLHSTHTPCSMAC